MATALKIGDWVEVRSEAEVLQTLDAEGRLDGILWMPEMFQFCGSKFQVQKRAHKSCDYTTPYPYKSRSIEEAVLLDTRCDGSAHDGCQARCTIIWKEAWLKRCEAAVKIWPAAKARRSAGNGEVQPGHSPAALQLWKQTHVIDPVDGSKKYVCQMTELPKGSTPLAWWDVRQYVRDFSSGNVTLRRMAAGFVYSTYYSVIQSGIGVGPTLRWLYNKLRWVWGGPMFPRTPGILPAGKPTPTAVLNLQPGEMVRVKSHEEILETITVDNLNRGMYWDAELVPYCGGSYRVHSRVHRLIDEKTAKMVEMKNACIVLDSVVCQARYSPHRMFCPRAMFPYWREIWLERI